jgi:transcriptional regulator with XRE-family HTH domain
MHEHPDSRESHDVKRLYALDPTLAQRLTARRRALRWSQNALALKAGLTEGLIAKVETLRTPYAPEHRRAIEAALDAGEQEACEHPTARAVSGR